MIQQNSTTGRFDAFSPQNCGRKIGSFATHAEARIALDRSAKREAKRAAAYWAAFAKSHEA